MASKSTIRWAPGHRGGSVSRRPRSSARSRPDDASFVTPSRALTPTETWEILDAFSARSFRRAPQLLLENDTGRALLRSALVAAVQEQLRTGSVSSAPQQQEQEQPPVMFGVCASSGGAARFALERYTQFVMDACADIAPSSSFSCSLQQCTSEPELRLIDNVTSVTQYTSPTFIKFAPGLHYYATPLPGQDRGVIMQIGDRQCSHLPLGLFGMPST